MYCPDCGTACDPSAQHCAECGADLPGPCPSCGYLNTLINRFCCHCGESLAVELTPVDSALSGSSERVERRQLTVLFCDLVGSTALSQHLDPEDLRDLIHAFQQQCAEAINQFDGYVARYMGDGLLAYFGYPQAHELDAERAVRAGLAMIERIGVMPALDGRRLQLRVGIETGEVVAGDIVGAGEAQEHTVLGDTPNIAARLQALAEPNRVLIGAGTERIVTARFALQPLGMQTLKGIVEPVPVYWVRAVTNQHRFCAVSPVLGRDAQLAQLAHCLSEAETGAGGVVVIEADSGFGKTHLLEHLIHTAAGRLKRAVLRCSPFYRDRPMYPLIRHWQSLLELNADVAPGDIRQRLVGLLQAQGFNDPELQQLIAVTVLESEDKPGQSPQLSAQQRQATRGAFVELVRQFSACKPMLIAFEDAHWIDSSTAKFLLQLAQQINHLPVLLVLTSRQPLEWLSDRSTLVTRLQLNPLADHELSALVDTIASGRGIPAPIRQQILQLSAGSPLYVEELTKAVLEQQQRSGQTAELFNNSAARFQVPSSLQDSLRARLDRLGAAKEVAQFVSVLGRQFSFRLILACSPFADDQTELALQQLVGADLLVATGSGERRGYAFRHMMLRELAYQSLLKSVKRNHHHRIAAAIKQQFPDMVATTPEILAWHYEAAGETAAAIHYWHQAGLRAFSDWAHIEASNHYYRAIDLLASADEGPELLALELILRIDLVYSLRIMERSEAGLEQLHRAKVIAQQLDRSHELAVIHNLVGNLLFAKGDVEGCLASHQTAIDNARQAGSVVDQVQALSGVGDANLLRGHMITAEQAFDRCLQLCQSSSDAHQPSLALSQFVSPNLSLRGHLRLYLNRLSESERDISEAIELAAARDDRRAEMVARGSCLAKTLCEQGRYDDARQNLEQALEVARGLGVLRFESLYLLFIVRTGYQQGSTELLRQQAEQAIDIARRTEFRYVGSIAFGAKALVLDDPAERILALDQGEQLLATNRLSQNYLWFLRDAIEVSLVDGNWDRALHYADLLQRYTAMQPLPWSDCYIDIAHCAGAIRSGDDGVERQNRLTALRQRCQREGLVAAGGLLSRVLPELN